jgi:hypothetical protein
MARSTLTKRAPLRPTVEKGEPARLDLGTVVLPKGTPVTATTVGGDVVVGSLLSVEYRDGVPYTASIYAVDGARKSTRSVYVDTVRALDA